MGTFQAPDNKMAACHILEVIHKKQIDGGSPCGTQ
jgi:hypothetical protein